MKTALAILFSTLVLGGAVMGCAHKSETKAAEPAAVTVPPPDAGEAAAPAANPPPQ